MIRLFLAEDDEILPQWHVNEYSEISTELIANYLNFTDRSNAAPPLVGLCGSFISRFWNILDNLWKRD